MNAIISHHIAAALAWSGASATGPVRQAAQDKAQQEAFERQRAAAIEAEAKGIEVRLKDIARFKGVRGNQLRGFGLIVGLEGTGDTRSTPFTTSLLNNAMRNFGVTIDASKLNAKNVATVAITAELPPFAMTGNAIDVTVQSIGDAKSLQGGFLLQAELQGADGQTYAVAQGPVSIGGFNVTSGGNKAQKNHVNVGIVAGGAMVEKTVPTQVVFNGKLTLALDQFDITTAQRAAEAINAKRPGYFARALNGGEIEINLPSGVTEMVALAEIEEVRVLSDVAAVIVINERTGTIAFGGNVKLGPAVIAHGSLNIRIDTEPVISQPPPFSKGETVVTEVANVQAQETRAQIGLVGPTTTVADLAKLLQALDVTPRDLIAILQALSANGSLKARIKVQ
ncbi:MAG: flagellar basal body P-ring protein FlgI [Fimbriimonadaceae bacterium]|nr:flagellar basal body P-ring protein FlgI [Fimbriimonadaceae bacterium]